MKKYVSGLVFDTDDSESWIIGSNYSMAGAEIGPITLWRTPDGEWVRASTERDSHSLSRLTVTQAADAFTEAGIDLPDELVGDLESDG